MLFIKRLLGMGLNKPLSANHLLRKLVITLQTPTSRMSDEEIDAIMPIFDKDEWGNRIISAKHSYKKGELCRIVKQVLNCADANDIRMSRLKTVIAIEQDRIKDAKEEIEWAEEQIKNILIERLSGLEGE